MKHKTIIRVIWIVALTASVFIGKLHASKIIQYVAKVGNEATVGIYCKRGKYESYYGTGVVVSPDGYILTSTTVVPEGCEVEVYFTDHRKTKAEIIEINEEVESSLIKVDAENLRCIPVTDKMPLIGEPAYSFGNANNMIRLGENASFSAGVISGIYNVKSSKRQSSYSGLAIETDASINPGQDGGPLLNSQGQLVGIVSLSYSHLRWQGVAVPVSRILERLKHFKENKVTLHHHPLSKPTSNRLQAKQLADKLRKISDALVQLKIKRKYAPEELPGRLWSVVAHEVSKLEERQARQIINNFFRADKIVAANQQFRRPVEPVTGVLISSDGYILTSLFNIEEDSVFIHKNQGLLTYELKNNVNEDLLKYGGHDFNRERNEIQSITAVLKSGKEYTAKIVARHIPMQIALLKIEGIKNLTAHYDITKVAADPRTGQSVLVMGAMPDPGIYDYTVNTGVVSVDKRSRGNGFQIDAIINFGNSGGPVIGLNGAFLGIAANPISRRPVLGRIFDLPELMQWQTGINSGVSPAARSDRIAAVLPRLKKGETVVKYEGAFLGISQDRKSILTDQVKVYRVVRNSSAEKAGIKRGDVITHMNNTPIKSWKHMVDLLLQYDVGDTITLKIKRKKEELELKVTLGERP